MKRALLLIIVGALYVLHQDFWFWRTARPLVLGSIPIGLFYHACYTVATALMMWLLVKHAWPTELEDGGGEGEIGRAGDGATRLMGDPPVPLAPSRPLAPSPRRPVSASPALPVAPERGGDQ